MTSPPRRTRSPSCSPAPRTWRARPSDDELERWRTWDAAWPEFPFRSRSLNGLVLGDVMIDLAQDLLGTDDVRLYLAIVTAKYAGQPSEYNQLLHTDFPNHTLTVPRAEPGYQQMETFIYLNDVGPHNGATRFVSRTRTRSDPGGAAHVELRGLRRPLRRARRRLGPGRIDRRLPPRRLSPVGGLHRPDPGALHAPRRRTSPRRWNGVDTRRGPSRASRWSGTTSSSRPRPGN